jgi:anti-sigma factor RsiW
MKSCGHKNNILRYLDNELTSGELENLSAHLSSCADCRAQLEEEQALSQLLRQSRPLYRSPVGLRARVSALLTSGSVPNVEATGLQQRVERALRHLRLGVHGGSRAGKR